MSPRSASGQIFSVDGVAEVDVVDIGKGTQPCEDIGEFFVQVVVASGFCALAGGFVQRSGQFTDLLDKPHESGRCAASLVSLVVAVVYILLEIGDRQAWRIHSAPILSLEPWPQGRV